MEKENIWSAQDVIGMCEKYMNEEHVADCYLAIQVQPRDCKDFVL